MRRRKGTRTLGALPRLLIVSAYTVTMAASPWGGVVAQSTMRTQEKVIIREIVPAPDVMVPQPPPPPREEPRLTPPSPGHVWVPGYWTWGNNEWVWVYGRWERPPERMATWVPGQWLQRGDTWIWRAGYWQ